MKRKILFVAMQMSIHTARWINQISRENYEIYIFPIEGSPLHKSLKDVQIAFEPLVPQENIIFKSRLINLSNRIDRAVQKLFPFSITHKVLFKLKNFVRSLAAPVELPKENYTFWDTESFIPTPYGPESLLNAINRIKPDLIHSLEFQTCGYNVLASKLLSKEKKNSFPKWLVTNWGSDIYFYQHQQDHLKVIKNLLHEADFYSCECHRDIDLAINLGFSGKVMPVLPNTGGFDIDKIKSLREKIAPSNRKLLMIKGYQHFAGRALTALEAVEHCSDLLKDYKIVVYSSTTKDVWDKVDSIKRDYKLDIAIHPHVEHETMLMLFSQARIYLGVSVSDAISTSMLEAVAMGAFPIQTNTSCCYEWIKDGESGHIISPDDLEGIVYALKNALENDALVNQAYDYNWITVTERLNSQNLKQEVAKFYRTIFEPTHIETSKKMQEWLPKVSIIIPVFDGSNYLQAAIESALAQTYKNIEIIVVNDGSADAGATRNIALSYGDRIRYFEKPNGGVASALNYGISQMKGDYFSWLSHDDLYTCEKVERQIYALSNISDNKKVVIYSDYSVFTTDPDNDIICKMKGISPGSFRYWITVENCLHGCTLLIPKSAFQECGLFNVSLRTTQDYDLWFRIAKQYQFIHIPESLVKARSHSEQGSITMGAIALKECNTLLLGFARELETNEIQLGSQSSVGLGYANIAASMWYRGFFPTGRMAAFHSIRHMLAMPLNELLLASCIILKGIILYHIVKPMRKLFSPYTRLVIKQAFNSIFEKSKLEPVVLGADAVKNLDLKQKFSMVYENNIFNGRHSRSGEGSDLVQTEIIREQIPKLLTELNINTFLDAPCGDWFWMKHTKLGVSQYIGVDIVDTLIEKNQNAYGNQNIHFRCIDIVTEQLPKVDLIFTRDCLVHLSFQDAMKVLQNFKLSGAKYLLATTFTDRESNQDLGQGFWRTLNLQLAPFNFPVPLKIINEKCTEGNNEYSDKSLGLWCLDDITL